MPLKRDWHHQDIIAEVRKRGTNLAKLSLASGYGRSTLSASLYRRHPKAHAIIARFLGVTRHEVWPGWYDPNDKLLPLNSPSRKGARP